MADYIFDQMTASDAAAFAFPDTLKFANASVWTLQVTDNPATVTDPETFTITENGHSLTFAAHDMLWSSAAAFVGFTNGDGLELGGEGVDYLSLPDIGLGHANRIDSFGGDDVIDMTGWGGSYADDIIDAGEGNDTIIGSSSHVDELGHYIESDVLQGGAGNDDIAGGEGNDHIYGNLRVGAVGLPDGDDRLAGGDGNDFIQGNAGNDVIDGGAGNDRIYGGADNDSVTAGDGNDYIQGNRGADTLFAGDGDDQVRGGGDDDMLDGGSGNDILMGDAGNDYLNGGTGLDTLTGGAGNDVFMVLSNDDAPSARLDGSSTNAGNVETFADFGSGNDHIALYFGLPVVYHAAELFHSATAAENYAEQIMLDATQNHVPGANAHQIAALQVGQDTYLFYNNLYGTVTGTDDALGVNSAIRLVGVHADDITSATFGF